MYNGPFTKLTEEQEKRRRENCIEANHARKGEKRPWRSNKKVFKCLVCGEEKLRDAWLVKIREFCSHRCQLIARHYSPEKWEWALEGSSLTKYKGFNLRKREQVKKRDGYMCQLCSTTNNLAVHHIDYNKENSEFENLITLCLGCNNKVNFNREYWKLRLMEVIQIGY